MRTLLIDFVILLESLQCKASNGKFQMKNMLIDIVASASQTATRQGGFMMKLHDGANCNLNHELHSMIHTV